MGNHIDITMANSGVSFNAPLHAIRFGRGSLELQHDWTMSKGNHSLVWGMSVVRKRFNNNTLFHSSGQFQFDGHVTGFGNHEGFDRADFMLGAFLLLHPEQRRVRAAARHADRLVLRRYLAGTPGPDAELRHPLRALRAVRGQAGPQSDFDLAANQAGIRSTDFQECAARAVLSRRQKAAGYGGGDTFGNVVTDPDYNNLAPRFGFAWALPATARPAFAAAMRSSTTRRR